MSYHVLNNSTGNNSKFNEWSSVQNSKPENISEFYELEEAVVLDIKLADTQLDIISKCGNLVPDDWPDNYKGVISSPTDKNVTEIGNVLVRMLRSQSGVSRDELKWAKPLHITGIIEFPLLNEIVIVSRYRGELYYTRRLNINGFTNNNANFNVEKAEGNTSGNDSNSTIIRPVSLLGPKIKRTVSNIEGALGTYFKANKNIRALKKYEGDTSVESRHGQSIRFSAYDNVRTNDVGLEKQPNYYGGGGNPMIFIRNRQRTIAGDSPVLAHPLLPAIPSITESEKNTGGLIEEDINNDGSSIHITSGLTQSRWKTTVYKSVYSNNVLEEQPKFSPKNSTKYSIPTLDGDQIVINTDRLILSSRFAETMHYSKKRYSIATDSEYTVDADDQIVMTTNKKTVINSPAIYLGEYDNTNEPAILGQTMVDWLYDMCEWLKAHTHWYKHVHRNSPGPSPEKTQISVQISNLEKLQSRLHSTLSRRVFVTGGGYADGANGVSPQSTDGTSTPVKIDTSSGTGVPGGFYGRNSRKFNK